ncbi:hypothetical protein, partial [Agrobacterium vitis]|uniref:hypothetical protein n=1 Tax=Agrobacterium vitis TaxID=373 RepID=UPI001AEECFE9
SPLLPKRDHKWKIPVQNGPIYGGHVTPNEQRQLTEIHHFITFSVWFRIVLVFPLKFPIVN